MADFTPKQISAAIARAADYIENADGNVCLDPGEDERIIAALRTHHATLADMAKRLEAAERDAARYQRLRDADPDSGAPYVARERQDSWGNWKTEWLGGLDADRAIDATQEGEG